MPTKHPRLNITMESPLAAALTQLADRENKSVSSLARELILEALELREDFALSSLALARDKKTARTVVHDDAWC